MSLYLFLLLTFQNGASPALHSLTSSAIHSALLNNLSSPSAIRFFFSTTSYVCLWQFFHTSLSPCFDTSPPAFLFSLLSVFPFPFFPPSLSELCLILSLHQGSSSHHRLVLYKNITQHLVFQCTSLLLLFLLSEKRRGVIMFVSHIPVIPPQRHRWTIMSYCK